jgi:hypothetical protein
MNEATKSLGILAMERARMTMCFIPLTSIGFSLVLGLSVFLITPRVDLQAQGASPCVDPTSTLATDLRHGVGVRVSQPDTISANERTRLGLPFLAENQVTIVSDTTVCRTASLAYDAAAAHRTIDKPVVVLALGTRRLVIKDYRFGEWLLAILFDQNYTTMVMKFGI